MVLSRLNVKTVTRHSYRSARVSQVITLDRNSDDGIELERQLLDKTSAYPENHVCFDIVQMNGEHLYVMCTDSYIHIGTTIIIEPW